MTKYKTGQIVRASITGGKSGEREFRRTNNRSGEEWQALVSGSYFDDAEITDIVPLDTYDPAKQVVLDPEDRAVVYAILTGIDSLMPHEGRVRVVQEVLRSMLTKPEPEWEDGEVASVLCSDGEWRLAFYQGPSKTGISVSEGIWRFADQSYRRVSESQARKVRVEVVEDES